MKSPYIPYAFGFLSGCFVTNAIDLISHRRYCDATFMGLCMVGSTVVQILYADSLAKKERLESKVKESG